MFALSSLPSNSHFSALIVEYIIFSVGDPYKPSFGTGGQPEV